MSDATVQIVVAIVSIVLTGLGTTALTWWQARRERDRDDREMGERLTALEVRLANGISTTVTEIKHDVKEVFRRIGQLHCGRNEARIDEIERRTHGL